MDVKEKLVEKTAYQESVFTYPTYLNFLTESDDTKEGQSKVQLTGSSSREGGRMMPRLIDADAIIDFIDTDSTWDPLEICFSEKAVVDMLESAPTVDAVPVVRCKDCIHSSDVLYHTYCGYLDCVVYPHFYCAGGKRKDGDGNG